MPGAEARKLLAVCSSKEYDLQNLMEVLIWASQNDYEEFASFIVEKNISLQFLPGMPKNDRAGIFEELLNAWGGPEEIVASIAESRQDVQAVLRWATQQRDAAICCSIRLKEAFAHHMDHMLYETAAADVNVMLLRLGFAGDTLPGNISETVPLAWLEGVMDLDGSRPFVADTLLMRMEQSDNATLLREFPRFWCPVWSDLSQQDCHRAVGLVARHFPRH